MLREIRDLGFEYAELSHGIRISLLPGVLDAVAAGEIKISTLHNFCPLPMGVNHAAPNIFKFTSTDARERDNAFKHTMKTLETAERVNAKLVVLHMGCIDMNTWYSRVDKPERPDFVLFDLDPSPDVGFKECVQVALLVKQALDAFGLVGFPKISSGRGMHVRVEQPRLAS